MGLAGSVSTGGRLANTSTSTGKPNSATVVTISRSIASCPRSDTVRISIPRSQRSGTTFVDCPAWMVLMLIVAGPRSGWRSGGSLTLRSRAITSCIRNKAGFARPERIASTRPEEKGAALCLGPDDGPSFWQPEPSRGHVTVKLWHGSMPSNMFAMGTQTLAPGGRLGPRAFAVGEGVFFVYRGRGRAIVNGQSRSVAPESLIYVGRGATHDIQNGDDGELSFAWVVTPPGLETLVRRIGIERSPGAPAPAPFEPPIDARDSYRRCRMSST